MATTTTDDASTQLLRDVLAAWERHCAGQAQPDARIPDAKAVYVIEGLCPGFFLTLKRAAATDVALAEKQRLYEACEHVVRRAESAISGFNDKDVLTSMADYDHALERLQEAERERDVAVVARMLWHHQAWLYIHALKRRAARFGLAL